ncbi:MAG: cobalamin biosynthesis protein CobD [Nitrospirae bacterium]|nr:cobalamin biosynthesis protein CobD [Nitrospirota bacterium]
MIGPLQLILAFLLDLAIGDPRWLPHPVRLIGKAITTLERYLRPSSASQSAERRAGVLLVFLIVLASFLMTLLVLIIVWLLPGTAGTVIGMAIVVYFTAATLASRELITSARSVIREVSGGNLPEARLSLGMIVGRDTDSLSANQILKATMETLSENLSDGFIAPLFYLVIGGLPLAMAYKATNTLDSMVGYKNDTYRHFGWAAARLDDIANYLPARLTGVLIVVAAFLVMLYKDTLQALAAARYSFITMLRDGRKHTSPNSGIPEAAMAGAIGIRMGGPATYGGIEVDKPYIGEMRTGETAEDYLAASEKTIAIAKFTVFIGICIAVFILSVRRVP